MSTAQAISTAFTQIVEAQEMQVEVDGIVSLP